MSAPTIHEPAGDARTDRLKRIGTWFARQARQAVAEKAPPAVQSSPPRRGRRRAA